MLILSMSVRRLMASAALLFRVLRGLTVFTCLALVAGAAHAAAPRFVPASPTQITPDRPVYGSLQAAQGHWQAAAEQYNAEPNYECHLDDWTWSVVGRAVDHVYWTANKNAGSKCAHNVYSGHFSITAICPYGFQIEGDGANCVCPAGKEENMVLGTCVTPCAEGYFRGPVTGLCKKRCPAGEYLTTAGVCKPWPPCGDLCVPPDADPERGPPTACAGNPINVATGNKYQPELDLQWGPDLQFRRYYNSRSQKSVGLGVGWSHSYSSYIDVIYKRTASTPVDLDPDYMVPQSVLVVERYIVVRASGESFAFSSDGKPIGNVPENIYTLNLQSGGLKLSYGTVVENYDALGRLISISARDGSKQTLDYDSSGSLRSVSDSRGYKLSVAQDARRRIIGVSVEKAGIAVNYGYTIKTTTYGEEPSLLTSVTRPNIGSKTYHYESPFSPYWLTGITDEDGKRFASWSYDAQGRATSSEHNGGVNRVSLIYSEGSNDSGQFRSVEITDSLGAVRTSLFNQVGGKWRLTSQSQPGGIGCGPSASLYEYDPTHGTLTSSTDFRGTKTVYIIDPVTRLETSRTEAKGTPRERTITTVWDVNLRKKKTVTEPKRRIDYEYDSVSGRLKWVDVTDTSVSPNVTRRTSYSYSFWDADINRVKQILVDGPRTDVADVVTYDYDQSGNLTRVTRKVGSVDHVTTWSQYDGGGRPALMTTPNSLSTFFRYNSRGQLVLRIDGYGTSKPQSTAITYYPTSLLKQVNFPDGRILKYQYDDAQRPTEIHDGKGNFIRYTLDKAGNVLEETLNDTSVSLQATIKEADSLLASMRPQMEGL